MENVLSQVGTNKFAFQYDWRQTKMKNIKCPDKYKNCGSRKIIDYIRPYNFCKKLNVSYSGDEPKSFFKCGK